MNKVLIIVLLVLVVGGLYLIYSDSAPNHSSKEITQETMSSQEVDREEASKSLHELQSSIQGVIADSVQDEIQEAVESEMKKSAEKQK